MRITRYTLIFILFILYFIQNIRSQDESIHKYVIENKLHIGKIVKNYSGMPDRKNAMIYELMLACQTTGNKNWQQIYGLPQTGISLYLGRLGNKDVLGNIYGIVPNITFNTMNQKIWQLKVSLGIGLAYFDQPFHESSNPENKLIGSAITNMSTASVYAQCNLSKSFSAIAGFTSIHCSNGHYQVPNVGLNMPACNFGIKYYPGGRYFDSVKKKTELPKGKIKKNIRVGIGIHEFAKTLGPVGGQKQPVYITSFYLSKRFGKVSNVHMGVEFKHYTSYYRYIEDSSIYAENQRLKATVFTFFMAHELMINKLSLVTQGGLDLYNQFYNENYKETVGTKDGLFRFLETITSTRLGLQYYLFDTDYNNAKNVFFGLYIKANFGQADFICMNIGYTF